MGTKLVRRKGLTAALLLVAAACPPAARRSTTAGGGPQVAATVVTIRTTVQPANRTLDHTISIAAGKARSSDELDRWRIYDIDHETVTFVDGIARTWRSEPLVALLDARARAEKKPLPDHIPAATFETSTSTRAVAGTATTESTIRAGDYVRRLWVGNHPAIPPRLFALMTASEPLSSSPFAPMTAAADRALLEVRGFPLAEEAQLPFLDRKLELERSVVKVEVRPVPAALFEVPAGYTQEPVPAPAPRSAPRARKAKPSS